MDQTIRRAAVIAACLLGLCLVVLLRIGKQQLPEDASSPESDVQSPSVAIRQWHSVEGFASPLAQFETVFWEPDDTTSLRAWLSASDAVVGSDVLEIGTGTGLISLHVLRLGANHVVATDINPQACANARYNAEQLEFGNRLEVRQVNPQQPGPFAVIADQERFDFIISNPPWESAPVLDVAAYAFYDPDFKLLDALLEQAAVHLRPNGKLLLAYGAKTAIKRIQERGPQQGWTVTIDDPRELDTLPEVFLPGMLLELSPQP